MNEDEEEEGFVDVGPEFGGAVRGRDPLGGGDAVVDEGGQLLGGGVGVGLEELGFDLSEDVADRFAFFGDLEGEGGFEVGYQGGGKGGLEMFDVGHCEQ